MAVGLISVLGACSSSHTTSKHLPPPPLPSEIMAISTPEKTQEWLKENLTYKRDMVLHSLDDFWAPCALTYQLRAGDCDDYAICAAAILQDDILEGYIIYLDHFDRTKGAHAVFAYHLNGQWGIISNNNSEFRKPLYSTLDQALFDSVGDKYNYYKIYDYSKASLANGNNDLESKMIYRGIFFFSYSCLENTRNLYIKKLPR